MLKILVDGTSIRPRPSGIGLYAYHLIEELDRLQTAENFQLAIVFQPSVKNWLKRNLLPSPKLAPFADLTCLPLPVSVTDLLTRYPNPLLDYLETFLDAPDILHGLDHVVFPCRGSRKVMTIHDVTFLKYPRFVTSIVRSYATRVKRCLKWTDLIVANSESTKRDIVEYLGVNPTSIHVTPLASRFQGASPVPALPSKRPPIDGPYLLYVGTLEPRKNLPHLIDAFHYLRELYKLPHRLVLIGKKGWGYGPIFEKIERSPFRESILHLDYPSDEAIPHYYRNADVFVYPSFYEGFGLPVLEAMTLGCPVVTSRTSSLPEVTGDAAILVDPRDSLEIAEAIAKVVADTGLRKDLIARGHERATLFSWEKTARETLAAYRSLL